MNSPLGITHHADTDSDTTWYCGKCLTMLGDDPVTRCPVCSPALRAEPITALGPQHGFDYSTRCECGSEKTYGPGALHSTWCAKARQ